MQHLFTLLGNYSVGLDLSLDEKGQPHAQTKDNAAVGQASV